MLEAYLQDLSRGDQRYLLRRLAEGGFDNGPIELNTFGFVYDEDRHVVIVEGFIEGDEIDKQEYLLPDFLGLVKAVLGDVDLEEEE